jgi:hypothetical protein
MADEGVMTGLVLKIQCGQTLNTVISGVPVQIACEGSAAGWTPPEPPSGGGGVVAFAEVDPTARRVDVDALVTAFRENRLDQAMRPLDESGSAALLFEARDGGVASLDSLMSDPDV